MFARHASVCKAMVPPQNTHSLAYVNVMEGANSQHRNMCVQHRTRCLFFRQSSCNSHAPCLWAEAVLQASSREKQWTVSQACSWPAQRFAGRGVHEVQVEAASIVGAALVCVLLHLRHIVISTWGVFAGKPHMSQQQAAAYSPHHTPCTTLAHRQSHVINPLDTT